MSALIWVVMTLLCAVSLAKDCGSGFQVSNCSSDNDNIVGELEYALTSNKLAIENWKLCPRSDSIPQWRVSFELIVFGVFCNDMEFNSSIVCVSNGALVIKREQFENQNGTYNFNFISSELESSLQIMFAPTGVCPLNSTVHVNEDDDYAKLTWLIFDSNVPITIRSFRGGTLLTDGISSKVDGISVVEGNECISTESGESTKVWNVFIDKPNRSAEGDYVLVVNNSIGQSSATVQLIVDSISPSSTIMMIPSTSLIVSTSESFTESSTSTTTTASTTSTASTPVKAIISITLSVVAVVIVGCTVIVILLVLLRIFSLKRRREEVASDELAKPESVEIPDNVNSNLTPNNARPSPVGQSTSDNDKTVTTIAYSTIKGTSIDNYPGITNNYHEYNNEGGEHTDSTNVTSTPQLDTRQTLVPPDNPLSNNSEGDEDTDSRDVTTTPQLSTRQTLTPPDNPLASHSGTSLTEQLLQKQLDEQKKITNYLKVISDKQSEGVEVNKGILLATETTAETQLDTRAIQRETHSLMETGHVTEQENTLDNVLYTAPDISELNDLVGSQITSQWELFGAQVGLKPNDLEILRSENAQVRFYHLFNEWKRTQCSDFTWDAVIKVLQSNTINQPTLAKRVLRHLENPNMNTV